MEHSEKYLKLHDRYSFHSYGHALEILETSFATEFEELLDCLDKFSINLEEITEGGGNESRIPKKIGAILKPLGWREIRIKADLVVTLNPRQRKKDAEYERQYVINGYVDGHNIDYVKGAVAFDVEWNSKDQTFDRDLMAFKDYFDCGVIDVGIILTRGQSLNPIFKEYGLLKKYGASTTHDGKLIYRLDARRNGGCPILAISIEKGVLELNNDK